MILYCTANRDLEVWLLDLAGARARPPLAPTVYALVSFEADRPRYYVGSSTRLTARLGAHFSFARSVKLRGHSGGGRLLAPVVARRRRALVLILETCPGAKPAQLQRREQAWILAARRDNGAAALPHQACASGVPERGPQAMLAAARDWPSALVEALAGSSASRARRHNNNRPSGGRSTAAASRPARRSPALRSAEPPGRRSDDPRTAHRGREARLSRGGLPPRGAAAPGGRGRARSAGSSHPDAGDLGRRRRGGARHPRRAGRLPAAPLAARRGVYPGGHRGASPSSSRSTGCPSRPATSSTSGRCRRCAGRVAGRWPRAICWRQGGWPTSWRCGGNWRSTSRPPSGSPSRSAGHERATDGKGCAAASRPAARVVWLRGHPADALGPRF